jgi:NAD-dependent deacetylase
MKIVVLTGAGISAESGIATFRDSDGLWEGHDPMEVATPEAYEANPALVQRFYDERRAALTRVRPNAAHVALARLEQELGDNLFLVTQNVDDLHERGGHARVHHMHGELGSAWCTACGQRHPWREPLSHLPGCPTCESPSLRPDIVWFGEVPYGMDHIHEQL